jgi:hypothetical protein
MTCVRLASMFAAAAVATLFQAYPVGAQPMTETSISTTIIPVEHVVADQIAISDHGSAQLLGLARGPGICL